MASMVPPTPVPGCPDSEILTFNTLANLADGWTVIHSVRWQSLRGRRQGDGEADFVLLHRRHGCIVLEVKGGEIHIENGVWYTTNRAGVTNSIKSPFEQGVASKHALVRFLRENMPGGERIPVNHAVVLPNVDVDTPLGLDAPLVLTIDRQRLRDINRAIAGVTAHWAGQQSDIPQETIDRIVARLRPTVEIRRVLRDAVRDATEELIRLTAQQIRVLAGLRRNRRARIFGGAGTGKTILAIEKAREFGAAGLKTLLTCFNEPLATATSKAMAGQSNVIVRHFHSLCVSEISAAGFSVPHPIPESWWMTSAADSFVAALNKGASKYDAIVLDEGQDFRGEWITALMLALNDPDESPFYVFMDSHQDLYAHGHVFPDEWPQFELVTNCRNTVPISSRVASVYGDVVDSLGAKGPEPVFEWVDSESKLLGQVESRVMKLLERERLSPSQITVLCGSRDSVEKLRTMAIGDYVFCEPGRRGVGVETIWRYKGLESDVIVLALASVPGLSPETAHALMYVGLSRPRAALYVIATRLWKVAPGLQ